MDTRAVLKPLVAAQLPKSSKKTVRWGQIGGPCFVTLLWGAIWKCQVFKITSHLHNCSSSTPFLKSATLKATFPLHIGVCPLDALSSNQGVEHGVKTVAFLALFGDTIFPPHRKCFSKISDFQKNVMAAEKLLLNDFFEISDLKNPLLHPLIAAQLPSLTENPAQKKRKSGFGCWGPSFILWALEL